MDLSTDLNTFQRSKKPNNYFIAAQSIVTTSDVDMIAPEFDLSQSALFELCLETWTPQKGVTLAARDDDKHKAHFIVETALLKFKDDVVFGCVELGAQKSSLLLYSASRIGYSDLGTNAKRITSWLNLLMSAVKKT